MPSIKPQQQETLAHQRPAHGVVGVGVGVGVCVRSMESKSVSMSKKH